MVEVGGGNSEVTWRGVETARAQRRGSIEQWQRGKRIHVGRRFFFIIFGIMVCLFLHIIATLSLTE